jgi:hypothetical protein
MHSPALALAWQLWSRNRVLRWTFLGFAAGMLVILHASARMDESVSTSVCLYFVAIALLTGLMTSWSLSLDRTPTEVPTFPRWMLTLPLRTEALVGWPMLYGTVFIALAWPAWVWLVLGPCQVPAPLVWPAFLFAAVVAWFQVLTIPGRRSLRRRAGDYLVLGLLVASIMLLLDQCHEFRGEETLLIAGAASVPEAGLAAGFAGLIAVAYALGVSGLAALRRGDVRRRALVTIDGPWLSGWLPEPTGPFASPARAQLWLEWRLRGAVLPLLWAIVHVLLLVAGALTLLLMHGAVYLAFDTAEATSEVRRTFWQYAWCGLPGIVFFLMAQCAPASGMEWDSRGRVDTLPPLSALVPMSAWALVRARLQAMTIGLLAMWFLVVAEAGLLFLVGGERADVTAFVDSHFPAWNDLAFLAVAAVGGFVFLWRQLAQTMFFGFIGRWWITLAATVIHVSAMWVLFFVVLDFVVRPKEWLREGQPWLVALAGLALVVKLLAAAWAIQANYHRQLLSKGTLLRLVGLWLLTVVALTWFVVGLMPSGFAPFPWIAGGVILALPLARILFAPLVLAWNRHR